MVEPFVTNAMRLNKQATSKLLEERRVEVAAHEEFKARFPDFLRKIIKAKPHALVFLDRRARALSWATRRLWPHLSDEPLPKFYFVAPDKTDRSKTWRLTSAAAKKVGVKGKNFVVVDECVHSGASIEPVASGLMNAGAKVHLAIYHKPLGGAFEPRWNYIWGDSLTHPGWNVKPPLRTGFERKEQDESKYLFCDTTSMRRKSKVSKARRVFLDMLRTGVVALADEIISTLPKKYSSVRDWLED